MSKEEEQPILHKRFFKIEVVATNSALNMFVDWLVSSIEAINKFGTFKIRSTKIEEYQPTQE